MKMWNSRLYYTNTADDLICVRNADGTGEEQVLRRGFSPDISPDGKWMIFDQDNPDEPDVFVVALPGDSTIEARAIVSAPSSEFNGKISPSGNFLAYVSDESGQDEVYLTRFPDGGGKWQVSDNGGDRPRWDPDGGRIVYVENDAVIIEVIVSESPLRLGNPARLFNTTDARAIFGRVSALEVARGGERLIMSRSTSEENVSRFSFVLVENWLAEFKKK
jgi:Tol biopolymer transport system component